MIKHNPALHHCPESPDVNPSSQDKALYCTATVVKAERVKANKTKVL